MHLRSSALSVLGAAALALLAGCATSQQQTQPDGPTAVPPRTEPVTNPSEPSPSSGSTPWHSARVGDRVAYTFSVNQSPSRGVGVEARLAGRLAVEVVAVQAPWVWLKLSFADEAGKALASPMLARELVLPMNMEATRPLDVPREGTESVEQLSAVGRTWEARRYIQDNRPADGPLQNRLYAVSPGPLYLMNGLLSASTTLSGFGASGGSQLTLVEARRGAEGTPAVAPPALEHPAGPGTWFDVSVNPGSGDEVQRTCASAERGYVLNVTGPVPAAGGAPCPSFTDGEIIPLEESLLSLVNQGATVSRWPPPSVAPTSRGTFSAQGRGIASATFETPETEGATRQLRYETYAADPWDPALRGLSLMARFSSLTEGVDRLEGKGQRKPTFTRKLTGWGVWAGGAK